MLREIHHRVKNNLQMISSLLNLQAGEIRSPRIRRFFGDAQNRVLTLSILHRHAILFFEPQVPEKRDHSGARNPQPLFHHFHAGTQ